MDSNKRFVNPSPEKAANIFSKLFFCWMFSFLKNRYRNGVEMKDIYSTAEEHMAGDLGDLLERNWNTEIKEAGKTKEIPSLLKVIVKTFGFSFMKLGLLLVIEVAVLKSLQPQLFHEFLRYFQDVIGKETEMEIGWILGVVILLVNFLGNLIYQQYFVHCQVIGLKVKVSCSSLIYRKILKLSHSSLTQTSAGEIVNLLSNDLQRIEHAAVYFHYIYAVPLQVIAMVYITYNIVGTSCVPGLLFVIVEGIIVQGYLSKVLAKLRSDITKSTGARLEIVNDIISGIHVIKMYAWEKPFQMLVEMARKLELDSITKLSYTKAITVAMVVFTERLSLFLTILVLELQGNSLNPALVFSVAQLVNLLQASVCYYLPLSFESYTDIKLSISRVQEFLLLSEQTQTVDSNTATTQENIGSVNLTNVSSGWLPNNLTLTELTLNFKPGTLCCILGKLGAGKTSLLFTVLRELPLGSGKVDTAGNISYASQEPWLFVASVRSNILFGQTLLHRKYQEVVEACALSKDFQQLPYRDQTMVGERGVSLSGGQRARVNLARAVYQDADIYLLDDPLSAVDIHVAKTLFVKCVMEYLKNKTRILVTHQIQFVKQADLIVILEQGKISNIMMNGDILEDRLNEVLVEEDQTVEESSTSSVLHCSTMEHGNQLDKDEEMLSKNVSISSYARYFSSGSSICCLITTLILFVAAQIVINMTDIWIMYWSNKDQGSSISNHNEDTFYLIPESDTTIDLANYTRFINTLNNSYEKVSSGENVNLPSDKHFYLYVYSALVLVCVCLSILRPMVFCKVCLNASRSLHRNLLVGILQAPMKFFGTNPSGRILNRFSKDMGVVDDSLLNALLWTFQIYLAMTGIIVMLCVVAPWIMTLLLITTVTSYYTIVFFLPTLLNIVKLEANSRSPIYSHISATISGLPTVRASKVEEMVKKCFDSLQDIHTSTQYMSIICCRSFCFYLESVFNIFLAVVIFKFLIFQNDGTHSGGIGLVMTHASIMSGILQHAITMTTNVINATVSVERVLQYTNIEREGSSGSVKGHALQHWPRFGTITFQNVSLSYVAGGPPVLKNLDFDIRAGEKIGIVGRTGAGKSSLITCLLRLAQSEGIVLIDDLDTSKIDLKTLRLNISVIPQEPILFSTSLRHNLDPWNKLSDEDLWKALENVKLKEVIGSLDQKVNGGGSSFSVGQRQLICLARAILRNNKILVMDEATSNVDTITDASIQDTIRENFHSCTVLTIAHRLDTVVDSDRVLVMDSGRIVEFAHPHELLQDFHGFFSQMVRETDKNIEANLRDIAMEDFKKKFFNVRNNL